MKKILFTLIFSLLIQPIVFAEGEISENLKTDTEITGLADESSAKPSENTAEDTSEETPAENGVEAAEPVEENKIDMVNIYIFSHGICLSSFPAFESETLMLPIKEFLSHLGANDFSVDEENQITITYGENIVAMHLGSTNASFNHEDAELPCAPFLAEDIVYAPAEAVCKALGFTYKSDVDGTKMSVYADLPQNELASEKAVNSKNLSSQTQYLIWVNKSKYTVYVFLGENKNWREVYSCKCAIGAPGSPTKTGVFKYFSRESRWTYDKFYVGPIMRFYGSYAIHSTLLKYDGTDYNNAVGVKNSHGCVRVRPDNLSWLISYVPLNTTVYVSEN